MPPAQPLSAELRALPRAFWVVCAGMFINRFGTFVYPFLATVLHKRGFSLAEIGVAVGAFGCGGIGAALAGGWFVDRYGRRNAIALGTFGQALFVFLLYYAQALPLIVLLTALAGFMGGFFHPAGSALVADLVPPRLRLRAFSMLRLSVNAGFACGTATGGLLVNHSAFWLFAGDALTTAAYGALALWLLPHGLRQNAAQARWSVAFARLRGDARFLALGAAQLCASLVFAQITTALPLEVAARGAGAAVFGRALAPEQVFGAVLGLNGLLIVLCELPLTRFTQRFAPRTVMCLGYFLIGGGLALYALPGGVPLLFAGMAVFTLGEMLVLPNSSAWAAHLAPAEMRGRYLGALSTAWSAASVLGPGAGLMLFGAHPALLWAACGALGLLGAAVFWKFGDRGAAAETVPEPAAREAA